MILYQYLYTWYWDCRWRGEADGGGGRDIVEYTDVQQQNRYHHCVSNQSKAYKTIFMRPIRTNQPISPLRARRLPVRPLRENVVNQSFTPCDFACIEK